MKINKFILAAGCALLLSGCTQSTIVRSADEGPDLNIYENYDLDMDQLYDDVLDVGLDPDTYPMAAGIEYGIFAEEGYVNVAAIVKDDTSVEDAVWYASEVLKVINDQIAAQDLSCELSSDTSYGGLYESNNAYLDIYYESAFNNDEAPFLSFEIPAGMYVVLEDSM
jgi:hypothetical protein